MSALQFFNLLSLSHFDLYFYRLAGIGKHALGISRELAHFEMSKAK